LNEESCINSIIHHFDVSANCTVGRRLLILCVYRDVLSLDRRTLNHHHRERVEGSLLRDSDTSAHVLMHNA